MAAAALALAAGFSLSEVLLVVGAAVLTGLAVYALWHEISAAVTKLESLMHTALANSKHANTRKAQHGISEDMIDRQSERDGKRRGIRRGLSNMSAARYGSSWTSKLGAESL
jgi:hypothetical protein